MVSNKISVLAASAALLESALGAAHGHQHKHLDKRAYETDWVTEVVTVWVTPKEGEALPASCTGASSAAAGGESAAAAYDTPAAAGTTISTSIVVVPTTSTSAAAYTEAAVYSAPQTTLSTAVKSVAQVVSSSSSSVYQAPASSSAKASTTSAAAAASSSSSSSTYSGSAGLSHKRGLAYNDASLANTFQSSCTNCGWGYNWASYADHLDSSLSFVPQLWSTTQADVWSANATAAINAGSKVLFSFNEPDISGQALMSVSDCAAGHVEHMNPFKGKALIGSPAVSNSGETNQGLDYLEQWITTCKGLDEPCHYDFCNIHWYSAAQYSDTLFTQLESAYKLCGKPIWLTEFAPTDTDASTINSFLEEVIPKLEALDYLEGYAYFMVKTGSLLDSSSALSTFGQTYASASA